MFTLELILLTMRTISLIGEVITICISIAPPPCLDAVLVCALEVSRRVTRTVVLVAAVGTIANEVATDVPTLTCMVNILNKVYVYMYVHRSVPNFTI